MKNEHPLILVVDDNPNNIKFLGNLLMTQEYEIGVALSGHDALTFTAEHLPDLILLDIMMPGLDGYQVCRKLKESSLTKDIPVIFITAKVEQEDIIKGLEIGAVDYIKKPFNTTELLIRIKTHLDLKFSREKLEEEVQKKAIIQKELERVNNELQQLSNLDGLTKIANRRNFDNYLKKEAKIAKRENKTLSIIMCDVDHFKNYNDTYGHQMGDTCLQKIAAAISDACKRPGDLAARYGGEEFVVILPDTTPEGTLKIANAIKHNIEALQIPHSSSLVNPFVTISMGIATMPISDEKSTETLIFKSDKALYKAKHNGRNNIVQT